jgi:hypothetical protein
MKKSLLIALALSLVAVASRFLPHPDNFTPFLAIALFSGAFFKSHRLALAVPMVALVVSDFVLGFYPEIFFVYAAFALAVFLGVWMSRQTFRGRLVLTTFAGSALFFLISNFGVWMLGRMHAYAFNWQGLMECYAMALPFWRQALAGDLIYTFALFGIYALLQSSHQLSSVKAS